MVMSVWDDEYGISVHAKYQTTKENISEILKGFQRDSQNKGYEIMTVLGWDYAALVGTYQKAAQIAREEHVPVLIHVRELTQPQGHSTSGSHERYKNEDRLAWEAEYDCLAQMRLWMIANNIATAEEIEVIDKETKKEVLEGKKAAWAAFVEPIKKEQQELISLLENIASGSVNRVFIQKFSNDLKDIKEPIRKDLLTTARKVLRMIVGEAGQSPLGQWIKNYTATIQPKFSSHLFSQSQNNISSIQEIAPLYEPNAEDVDARLVLRDNFDVLFAILYLY
jgi:hypothetical protein